MHGHDAIAGCNTSVQSEPPVELRHRDDFAGEGSSQTFNLTVQRGLK
jgi:hypothetical protein